MENKHKVLVPPPPNPNFAGESPGEEDPTEVHFTQPFHFTPSSSTTLG